MAASEAVRVLPANEVRRIAVLKLSDRPSIDTLHHFVPGNLLNGCMRVCIRVAPFVGRPSVTV